MELVDLRAQASRVLDEVERAIVGKRGALELILLALLSDGHVLLEDYPGLAKTMIARSFAQATSLDFSRIQFTPDLMPSDVTGSSIFDQRASEFTFLPGPIFANLLLADEINRAPPKTQAALLEAQQDAGVRAGPFDETDLRRGRRGAALGSGQVEIARIELRRRHRVDEQRDAHRRGRWDLRCVLRTQRRERNRQHRERPNSAKQQRRGWDHDR